MTRALAPAAVPAWAWSDLRQLPDLRAERQRLAEARHDIKSRSIKALCRRERLREITLEILRREARLQSAGIDPVRGVEAPAAPRPFNDPEH
jgi:hypothetical protein